MAPFSSLHNCPITAGMLGCQFLKATEIVEGPSNVMLERFLEVASKVIWSSNRNA